MLEKSITPPDGWRHPSVLRHPCVLRTRDASEGTILLLTLGRALAYATPHSPGTPVERACTADAPYSQGKGMCGALLDASGGRAGTVVGAHPAEGPAGSVQRCSLFRYPRRACRGGRHPGTSRGNETAGCGLRGLETGRDGAGSSKLGQDGPWRPRAVLSGARRRRAVQEYVERYTRGVQVVLLDILSTMQMCTIQKVSINWLRVFRSANTAHLGHSGGQER